MTPTIGSLCSGYGGLDLAVGEAFGATTAWHAETDPHPALVLAKNFPGVPNIGDITAIDYARVSPVDILAAGFPCQPVSIAGRQQARDDHRWLWPHVLRGVRTLQPQHVVLENVQNLVSIQKGAILADILADLAEAGYLSRWCVIGACAVGSCHHRHRFFLVAEHVGGSPEPVRMAVDTCGAPRGRGRRSPLLPTPTARDGRDNGEGSEDYWERRRTELGRLNGMPLGAAVALLPTPEASDATGGRVAVEVGGTRPSGSKRAVTLATALAHLLLPTPRASDGAKGGPNMRGRAGDLMLPSAVLGERFAQYAPAIELWQDITGLPVPEPTEPNSRGNRRLAPAFAEWMMGLPPGWVTDHLDRVPALRAIGNGVVPMQAATAICVLVPTPVDPEVTA